ncbi:hypothetical protein O181_015348 [Austropuccinia psidii MF-1]|uniref:Integrase catalytic domain-containing protein n=1 Tax=Austropuccinia psidii MF-1 TaxID=1389203 RepID=A0A9Q3C325_9BASI|nr:hypothetical protein [Austropuccinia psidii MF-1]
MKFAKLIKQDEVQPSRFFEVKVENLSNLIESIQKAVWKDSQYRGTLQDLGKAKLVTIYFLDPSSNLLLIKYQVVIPNDPTIKLSILQNYHDSPLACHPGQEKTLKPFKQDFCWSVMTQFIMYYISSFQQCSRKKNIHHKKFGILKPLPIPNGPWICLSMDFITQLPMSNSFDSILVIMDRFSKIATFIPAMSSITSLDLAHLFIKNIFSKNDLPSSFVSDSGSLFVSSFWTNLCQQLNIERDLSTAYHPQSDGQTERLNQILERYLWMYVSTKIQSVQQYFNRELEVSTNRFERYSDESRESPPGFNPGDMVWLSSKNIKLARHTKTFSERWLGPFQILKEHQEPPPIIIEEEDEWEVSQILDSKLKIQKLWYLVEWKSFSQDPERSIWEPAKNLGNCPEIVKDFSSLYPDKPGPNSPKD